jgi:hypothetical protein
MATKLDNTALALFDFSPYNSFDELFYDDYVVTLSAPSTVVVDTVLSIDVVLSSAPKLSGRTNVYVQYSFKDALGQSVAAFSTLTGDFVTN